MLGRKWLHRWKYVVRRCEFFDGDYVGDDRRHAQDKHLATDRNGLGDVASRQNLDGLALHVHPDLSGGRATDRYDHLAGLPGELTGRRMIRCDGSTRHHE